MATISGKYLLNDVLTEPSWTEVSVNYSYAFSSGQVMAGCTSIALRSSELVTKKNNSILNYIYNFSTNAWINRTAYIDFGATPQTVSDSFYNWVLTNGRLESYPTTVNYLENEIASIETGQIATLKCDGKIMKGDVVVAFGSNGYITYNGTKTSVSSGQTATLSCSGEVMESDVVITT